MTDSPEAETVVIFRQVIAFGLLTFGVSLAVWLPIIASHQDWIGVEIPASLAALGIFGPAIATILLRLHVFDNLDNSGMKSTFRELLQYVADDSDAFESFKPIQPADAEKLVSTAADEAKKAADEDVQDADVLETVQEQINRLTDQTVTELEEQEEPSYYQTIRSSLY